MPNPLIRNKVLTKKTTSPVWNFTFDSGAITGLTESSNDITVATAAKLKGVFGLSILINDTTADYLYPTALSPVNTTGVWRWRFYFHPNSLVMGADEEVLLFVLRGSAANCALTKVSYIGATYRVSTSSYNDAAGVNGTSAYIVSDASHCIEVNLIRSATALSNNGSIELFIDNVSQEKVIGIDNFDRLVSINSFRLGKNSSAAGTSGTFYMDDFVLNDTGLGIGL